MAKTFPDFGIKESTEWAMNTEAYEKAKISDVESRGIAYQTQIAPVEPSYLSQLAALVGTDQIGMTIALFNDPVQQKAELFTFLMIPSLGPTEKIEEIQIPKIKAVTQGIPVEEEEQPLAWQSEREKRELEQEKNKVLAFIDTYLILNRVLVDIKARLGEYSKG